MNAELLVYIQVLYYFQYRIYSKMATFVYFRVLKSNCSTNMYHNTNHCNCSSRELLSLVCLWFRTNLAFENKRSTGSELHGIENS